MIFQISTLAIATILALFLKSKSLFFLLYFTVYVEIYQKFGVNISFFFSIFYLGLMLFFISGIFRLPKGDNKILNSFSILIAARNEEKSLPKLLNKLKKLDYPSEKFEIIIINDNSTDSTEDILNDCTIENFRFMNAKTSEEFIGKKNALRQGIDLAKNDYLLFTDADCLPPQNWLKTINAHISDSNTFVAGYSPLKYAQKSCFTSLKNLERASIFAVTAGSFGWKIPLTTTARNMCYDKSLYDKVDGFSSIGHIASGDDDLMLLKMRKNIKNYNFVFSPEGTVPAIEEESIIKEINQETRRGSKFVHYPLYVKTLAVSVLIYFIYSILIIFRFFWEEVSAIELYLFYLTKILHEFILLAIFLIKTKRKRYLSAFVLAEFLYVPYFIFFGLKGTFGKYKWKN